jgi:hypothetical protein
LKSPWDGGEHLSSGELAALVVTLTARLGALKRRDPQRDITAWAEEWNTNPRPYAWTKTADEILELLAAYCQRINNSGH